MDYEPEVRKANADNILRVADAVGHLLNKLGNEDVLTEDLMMGLMVLLRAYERLYIKETGASANVEKMALIANSLVDRIDMFAMTK